MYFTMPNVTTSAAVIYTALRTYFQVGSRLRALDGDVVVVVESRDENARGRMSGAEKKVMKGQM